jgi:hypothetical protein
MEKFILNWLRSKENRLLDRTAHRLVNDWFDEPPGRRVNRSISFVWSTKRELSYDALAFPERVISAVVRDSNFIRGD